MAFPTTPILETGGLPDEDPIETHWNGSVSSYIAGDSGKLRRLSNQITNQVGGGADTSSNYDGNTGTQQFSPPIEIFTQITTRSAVNGDQFKLPLMTETSSPTADGYEVSITIDAGADIWQLR